MMATSSFSTETTLTNNQFFNESGDEGEEYTMRAEKFHRRTKERLDETKTRERSVGLLEKHGVIHCADPYDGQKSWALDDIYAGTFDESDAYSGLLEEFCALVAASPSALLMLEEACDEGWQIGFADLGKGEFFLDVPQKLILLNHHGFSEKALKSSPYFNHMAFLGFVRALRDAWQELRNGAFEDRFGPEDILMMERIRAADLDVLAVLTAWELREAGEGHIWRHLIGSVAGDMAIAFSQTMELSVHNPSLKRALREAFMTWYRDEVRVNECDHETLEYLDEIVQAIEEDEAFGEEELYSVDIELLSCLPDRCAYLQGFGAEIMSGPVYAGLHSDINQAHFIHVLRDVNLTVVNNIPFQDENLAHKIFPRHFTGMYH